MELHTDENLLPTEEDLISQEYESNNLNSNFYNDESYQELSRYRRFKRWLKLNTKSKTKNKKTRKILGINFEILEKLGFVILIYFLIILLTYYRDTPHYGGANKTCQRLHYTPPEYRVIWTNVIT